MVVVTLLIGYGEGVLSSERILHVYIKIDIGVQRGAPRYKCKNDNHT